MSISILLITLVIAVVLFGLVRMTDNLIGARQASRLPDKDRRSYL